MGTDHDPIKPSLSRNARGKLSRTVINKTIPALLRSDPQARRGVEAAELIVDPPAAAPARTKPTSTSTNESQKHKRANSRLDHDNDGKTDIVDSQREGPRPKKEPEPEQEQGPKITLVICDTLLAAYNLFHSTPTSHLHGKAHMKPRIAILNMASPLRPGGGVLSGATSQEESLCRRTTLYPSLRDEFYRLPEVGGVYTPDVLVFNSARHRQRRKRRNTRSGQDQGDDERGDATDNEAESEAEAESEGETGDVKIDDRKDWFHVDIITAAMLRFPDLVEEDKATGHVIEKVYANQSDREMAVRRMRAVMRILRAKGVGQVVLGAWGCGAYGNPVGEIARAWRKVICGSPKKAKGTKIEVEVERYLDIDIVFAMKDSRMADAFAAAFGPGLRRVDDDGSQDDNSEGGTKVEDEESSSHSGDVE